MKIFLINCSETEIQKSDSEREPVITIVYSHKQKIKISLLYKIDFVVVVVIAAFP